MYDVWQLKLCYVVAKVPLCHGHEGNLAATILQTDERYIVEYENVQLCKGQRIYCL